MELAEHVDQGQRDPPAGQLVAQGQPEDVASDEPLTPLGRGRCFPHG